MSLIFISYRRDDGGHGRALYEFLCHWFDDADVFYDHEDLGPGQKFRPELTKAVRQSKVFLAVIGPHWFSGRNRQRLADADDTTRGEIQTALEQESAGQVTIIPVLCGGAGVPDKLQLPAEIADLCDSNAYHLPESQYRPAQQKLLDHLKKIGFTPRYRPRHGTTQIFHTIDHNLTQFFSDPAGHLSLLYSTLHETGKAAVTASAATATLHGMGGVGKTQLALKYSHDYRDEYAGVWWFRAEDLNRLQQDCQQFCERCGVQVYTGEEHHQAVKRWLQEQPRWLLVYDNAEAQYGEQKETLHPFLPSGDHHVLITSRNNCWDGLAQPIELDVWDEEQALEFLRKRLMKATDDELRPLCLALGGLPLALEQACAYIVKVGTSIDGYCRTLEDWEKSEKLLDRKDSLATGYSLSVLATLSLAFYRLSDAAKELLRLCAWCAPEPFPENFIRISAFAITAVEVSEVGAESNTYQWEELKILLPEKLRRVATDDISWGETVAELTGFALAHRCVIDLTPPGRKKQQASHAILLHRLIQTAVIHHFSDAANDASNLTELIRRVFPNDLSSTDGWSLARTLVPHVLRLEEHFSSGHVPHQALSCLLDKVATYMQNGPALYDQSVAIFRRALALDEKILGPDHPDTLASMNNLAGMLCEMGDNLGAKALREYVLERKKELLGKNHPDTLGSMNELATSLWKIGDHQNAKALQEFVLEHRKELFGPNHLDTLTSMAYQAGTLCDMGEYKDAKTLQEHVLECRKELYGLGHPVTLSSMNSLASTLLEMSDYLGAKALQEHVLERRKELLGPDHPDTLISMNNLASTFCNMGDYREAIALEEYVLEQLKKRLGPDHPNTLTSMSNLASTLKALGDHQNAKTLQQFVLERRKELLGPEHPDTLVSMNNLASTLWKIGDYQNAKALQEFALERRKKLSGSNHPDTIATMNNLALILWDLNDYQGSKDLWQHIIETSRELFGKRHPQTSKIAWSLYNAMKKLNDQTGAKTVIDEYLVWLLADGAELHNAAQRKISDMMRRVIASKKRFNVV